jgi:Antibiotic biosynthesis monooxygenase
MSFVFMVFHWPNPDQRETLAQSMREMREALLQTPGCVGVDPPYLLDYEGECLVGISKWESKEAFLAPGSCCARPTRSSKARHGRGSVSSSRSQLHTHNLTDAT